MTKERPLSILVVDDNPKNLQACKKVVNEIKRLPIFLLDVSSGTERVSSYIFPPYHEKIFDRYSKEIAHNYPRIEKYLWQMIDKDNVPATFEDIVKLRQIKSKREIILNNEENLVKVYSPMKLGKVGYASCASEAMKI